MNVCPFCHAPTRAGALFCARCGRPFVLQGSVRAYTVVRVLKSGGMASVYEAECGGVRYAIKEMLDTFTDAKVRQEAINRFMHEALTLARLNHPRIPKIHEHFTERGRFYLVMDFVEGQDLEDVLAQRAGSPLPESQVLHLADQICDVLEYLHSQQPPLIFRDLKPSNIMLTPTNEVRLIDFGIAKLFTPGQQGTMIGTPGYAAPEQYQGLAEPRTDVYGLGVTLHHLLTGRDPQRHPPFAFPPVRQLNPAVTAQTDAAVERAVKMDLYARFGSAREMRAALTTGQTLPRLRLPALVSGIVILVLVAFGVGVASVLWWFTPTPTPITGGIATLTAPVPAVVRLPTQPSPTSTLAPVLAKVVVENTVNIHAAPSRTGMIVGTLKKDAQVTLIGRSDDDQWYQIRISSAQQFGWVFGEVLQMVAGDPKTLPIVKSTSVPKSPPVCATDAGSSFARIWNDPSVYQRLGCPTGEEQRVASAVESFQGGFMLWRADNDRVYVVLQNGKWDSYPKSNTDMFRDGVDPEYSCGTHTSPPSPRRGFSKIWCNHSDVHSALGNATEYEQGFCMPGGGACEGFQDFLNGMMYRSTRFSSIYIFFADGTWMRK